MQKKNKFIALNLVVFGSLLVLNFISRIDRINAANLQTALLDSATITKIEENMAEASAKLTGNLKTAINNGIATIQATKITLPDKIPTITLPEDINSIKINIPALPNAETSVDMMAGVFEKATNDFKQQTEIVKNTLDKQFTALSNSTGVLENQAIFGMLHSKIESLDIEEMIGPYKEQLTKLANSTENLVTVATVAREKISNLTDDLISTVSEALSYDPNLNQNLQTSFEEMFVALQKVESSSIIDQSGVANQAIQKQITSYSAETPIIEKSAPNYLVANILQIDHIGAIEQDSKKIAATESNKKIAATTNHLAYVKPTDLLGLSAAELQNVADNLGRLLPTNFSLYSMSKTIDEKTKNDFFKSVLILKERGAKLSAKVLNGLDIHEQITNMKSRLNQLSGLTNSAFVSISSSVSEATNQAQALRTTASTGGSGGESGSSQPDVVAIGLTNIDDDGNRIISGDSRDVIPVFPVLSNGQVVVPTSSNNSGSSSNNAPGR